MLVHTVAKKVMVSAQSCGPCGDSIAAIGVRWFAACMQPKQWNWTQMKLKYLIQCCPSSTLNLVPEEGALCFIRDEVG